MKIWCCEMFHEVLYVSSRHVSDTRWLLGGIFFCVGDQKWLWPCGTPWAHLWSPFHCLMAIYSGHVGTYDLAFNSSSRPVSFGSSLLCKRKPYYFWYCSQVWILNGWLKKALKFAIKVNPFILLTSTMTLYR